MQFFNAVELDYIESEWQESFSTCQRTKTEAENTNK